MILLFIRLGNIRSMKIPVVLFTFRRTETVLKILAVLREAKIEKLYLFSDGPRNAEEAKDVDCARKTILESIDWPCTVIPVFHESNVGVFAQIGEGALSVFSKEERAIFLEDDNLPSISFFDYCAEMLDKFEDDEKILWVCGTNYEGESKYLNSDYVYTHHLLPCGWASWSKKFLKYYQTSFKDLNKSEVKRTLFKNYESKSLYRQQMRSFVNEKYREDHGMRFASWDFHMAYSIRLFNLYGIAPKINQITNIGIDQYSIHGGTTKNHPNTAKFCEIKSGVISFPMKGPNHFGTNKTFERNITKIILAPFWIRALYPLTKIVKKILGIYPNGSIYSLLSKK